MRGKKVMTAVAGILMGVFLITSASWAGGRITHRQKIQQRRIWQGVRSGQLTAWEFVRLEREQRRIQAMKRRAWADGVLTPAERVRLEWRQDVASHHIYRAKHNPWSR